MTQVVRRKKTMVYLYKRSVKTDKFIGREQFLTSYI